MPAFATPLIHLKQAGHSPPISCRCNSRIAFARCRIRATVDPTPGVLAKRQNTMRILHDDLLRQYESPRSLDWSIYDPAITFDDPMTKLSGRLQYRGMLLTIGLFMVPLLFKGGKADFSLSECVLTDELDKIRTTFYTSGITKWGSQVTISGVDYFWFAPNSHVIIRHQSNWDQTPDQIMIDFYGKKA